MVKLGQGGTGIADHTIMHVIELLNALRRCLRHHTTSFCVDRLAALFISLFRRFLSLAATTLLSRYQPNPSVESVSRALRWEQKPDMDIYISGQ